MCVRVTSTHQCSRGSTATDDLTVLGPSPPRSLPALPPSLRHHTSRSHHRPPPLTTCSPRRAALREHTFESQPVKECAMAASPSPDPFPHIADLAGRTRTENVSLQPAASGKAWRGGGRGRVEGRRKGEGGGRGEASRRVTFLIPETPPLPPHALQALTTATTIPHPHHNQPPQPPLQVQTAPLLPASVETEDEWREPAQSHHSN